MDSIAINDIIRLVYAYMEIDGPEKRQMLLDAAEAELALQRQEKLKNPKRD